MNKHFLAWLLVSSFIFVSCTKNEDPQPTPEPEAQPETPYVPLKTYYPAKINITTEGNTTILEDTYINATISIDSCNEAGAVVKNLYNGTTQIRGRGHSTWEYNKKPYRLKLSNKASLLDMPENKNWVLLANYVDRTLLRNELAFEISRIMEFAYTTRSRYADVTLNGISVGNYQLVEQLRVDQGRVNIPEIKADATDISGGYLLEIDQLKSEVTWFVTNQSEMVLCLKSPAPEKIPANQLDYIKKHVQQAEDILYGANGVNVVAEFPKYVDLRSFIDYFLLNELAKNVDGNLRRSTFLYKKPGDNKLYFGPIWDYDVSFGNAPIEGISPDGWCTRQALWYQKFFAHPEFNQKVIDRWRELRKERITGAKLNAFIDESVRKIDRSQKSNFEIWNILNISQEWPINPGRGTYANEIQFMKNWINERLMWMDSQL